MNLTDSNAEASIEVLAPSAILAMERASIDSQIATAHAYPRSMENFKRRSISMATMDTETADSCIYVRPVGKEKNDRGQWVQKYAEGQSIRLAEIVATSYGNLRVSAQVVEQTERFVRCCGTAIDLETNYGGKSECVESTVTKDGQPYSERQRALIAKVCLAKAYRDAIFRVVPRALCKPVYDAAKKVAAGQGQTLEQRRNKVKAWLGQIKVNEERLFEALDVNGWSDIGEEQLVTLTGLKTSITDGDTTLDEAFPPIVKTAPTDKAKEPVTEAGKAAAKQKPAATKQPEAKQPEPADQPPDGSGNDPAPAEQPQKDPAAKAAAAAIAATPAASGDISEAEAKIAVAQIQQLLKENELTEAMFMRYATANKIARSTQTKIDQIAAGKLVQIATVFPKIIGEIKKANPATPPAN